MIELTAAGVSTGIRIDSGGSTVRALVIHGFSTNLALFNNGSNLVAGCYIGTDPTGTVGSNGNGISIQNSDNNTIGGTTVADRNLISGLSGDGIQAITADGTIIQGNLIGSDLTGSVALGSGRGISIVTSSNTTIGGTVAGLGNLIAGSGVSGISVNSSSNTLIAGNLVGTDVTGTQALGNTFGIEATNLTGPVTIGGAAPAARNLLSGNDQGIIIGNGLGASVQGNFIGTDITGTLPLPNDLGILLNTAGTTDVLIGGTAPGEGNLIAFNQGLSSVHGIWNRGAG